MTIYQVIYLNNYGEKVADFGFYEDKLDAEKRAFDIRMKASMESGKVDIVPIFVHDCSVKKDDIEKSPLDNVYDFKN